MSDLLNKSLSSEDRDTAIESLRLLIKGIPIRDDKDQLIGFIEKPDMNAIKYVLSATTSSDTDKHNNYSGKKRTVTKGAQ